MRSPNGKGRMIMSEYNYIYVWRNGKRRRELRGKRCKILGKAGKNLVNIEFESGERMMVSRFAIRRISDE